MSDIKEKISRIKRNLVLAGAFSFSVLSASQQAEAKGFTPQDGGGFDTEDVKSVETSSSSYCDLACKVWDMYRAATSDMFGSFENEDLNNMSKEFFNNNKEIAQICKQARKEIGTIRGPATYSALEDSYPQFKAEINKRLSNKEIAEIDKIGETKLHSESAKDVDVIWRLYTYTATHGGVNKNNECANFFKKYPEFYNFCEKQAEYVKNIGIPLERTTCEDLVYYKAGGENLTRETNFETKRKLNLLNYEIIDVSDEVSHRTNVRESIIFQEARNIKVPDASSRQSSTVHFYDAEASFL